MTVATGSRKPSPQQPFANPPASLAEQTTAEADHYSRLFDRALAARYLQETQARLAHQQYPHHASRARSRGAPYPSPTAESALMPRSVRAPAGAGLQQAEAAEPEPRWLAPRLNMCDCEEDGTDGGRTYATLELPGIKKESIVLEVRGGFLVVAGDRRPPAHVVRSHPPSPSSPTGLGPSRNHRAHTVQEIRYGRFRRAIRLPAGVLASDVDAGMADGMLVVSWPRPRTAIPLTGPTAG